MDKYCANDTIQEFQKDPILVGFQLTLWVILELLGNLLLFAMIFYEKFGMDSQKRTISNQLLSSICAVLILFNIAVLPLWAIMRVTKVCNAFMRLYVLFGYIGLGLYAIFTTAEIVLVKTIYILKYARIASLNEYFISNGLIALNIFFIGFIIFLRVALKEYERNPYFLPNVKPTDFDRSINL